MLTPQKIQELSDPIEEIYEHIVDELLVNIGKHITAPTWTHTAEWEIKKLSELGQLTEENAAIINKWIKKIPPALRETMTDTRREALDRIERQLEQAAKDGYITPPMRDSTVDVLRELSDQAADRYNLVNSNMLQSSVEQYSAAVQLTQSEYDRLTAQARATQGILNDTAASVASGTETRQNAVRRALKRISDEGLTGFIDRAGREWSPEAYVNMVTRTTVHNTAIQATKARMEDFGTSVFQVSSHAGARPLCYPYQGKFYSWDNTSGEIELGNGQRVSYEPLNVTSYGEPAGLFGINCGHSPIPIIPGVTIPHGADNIQPKEENDKAYAESQEQRALERKIREAKRVVAMEGDLATKEDKARVKELQAEMREFIEQTGRTRRYDREAIGEIPGSASTKTEKTPPTFTPATSKQEAEEFALQFAKTVNYTGVSLENANRINEQLAYLENKYPINQLETIGEKPKHGSVMSASYARININGKKLGAVLSDEELNFNLNRAMNEESIRLIQERYPNGKIPNGVQSQIDKLGKILNYSRFGVHSSYENHVECVLTHEYGHVLSDQYFGMTNQERANPNYATNWQLRGMTQKWEAALQEARKTGDIYGLSYYGSTNAKEFFAESFLAYEMGEKLPPYVESLMQEVLDNGIM